MKERYLEIGIGNWIIFGEKNQKDFKNSNLSLITDGELKILFCWAGQNEKDEGRNKRTNYLPKKIRLNSTILFNLRPTVGIQVNILHSLCMWLWIDMTNCLKILRNMQSLLNWFRVWLQVLKLFFNLHSHVLAHETGSGRYDGKEFKGQMGQFVGIPPAALQHSFTRRPVGLCSSSQSHYGPKKALLWSALHILLCPTSTKSSWRWGAYNFPQYLSIYIFIVS